jgi:hypothetical protein
MDILFFSVNLVGCMIYFLYSFKSHSKKHFEEDNTYKNIDSRLSQLENQLKNQKS